MTWRRAGPLTLLILLVGLAAAPARALVADLSDHLIAIDTDYTGTEVVLFGTMDGPGDIVVVLRGPARSVQVRRKTRVAGVWVNGEGTVFDNVPGYYGYAASRPVAEFASEADLGRRAIGIDYLRFAATEDLPQAERRALARAIAVDFENRGLFRREVGHVTFVDPRLFRALLRFPANIPTGQYIVDVYLFQDGEVVEAVNTPLIVSRTGIGAQIFRFAHRHAAAYGIIAILIAVSAGWLAGVVFRRS